MRFGARAGVWLTALGVAVFEVVGTFGASHNEPNRRVIDAVGIGLVLLGPIALLARERAPRTVTLAAMASTTVYLARGYAFGPVFLSVAIALVLLMLRSDRTGAWGLAGLWLVGFGIAESIDPYRDHSLWIGLLFVAGWLAVVLTVTELVRAVREQRASRMQTERDEQRLEIARELHDVLAHNISLVNVQASVALHLIDDHPERARPALAAIKDASHEALVELRAALDVLRDGAAPKLPSPRVADLAALVDAVCASGLRVELDLGELPALPEAVELAAFRIVQEALTNVTRHAHATHAWVRVSYDDEEVMVAVTDDGVGGEPSGGKGLVGMRERAHAIGGTVDAGQSASGRGFGVTARLPVRL
jgi:signal transduction histidine kinase